MVTNLMRYLLALLVLCAASPALAAPLPAFNASYTVHKGSLLLGEMRRSLGKQDNGRQMFETETRSSGLAALFVKDLIVERSEWEYHAGRIRSLHYSYRKTGGKKDFHRAENS